MNPNDYPPDTHYMSYEFATWLTDWDRGVVGNNAYHTRNFKIARRRACYPQPLLNELGLFTEAGRQVLARADVYMKQLKHYYTGIGIGSVLDMPKWQEVTEMDRIILAGVVDNKHIILLRTLYATQFPEKSVYTHMGQMLPGDVEFEFVEFNGLHYMTTSALRNFPHRRKQFEFLVKLGLVELHNLPKTPAQQGRGKSPIGVLLSEQGRKFFEDYLERYDPMTRKLRESERLMREST